MVKMARRGGGGSEAGRVERKGRKRKMGMKVG